MINLSIIQYTFYSLLPYIILYTHGMDNIICDVFWKIPNYILSFVVFSHYISQIHVFQPREGINIINSRYRFARKLASKIETALLGMIYPMFGQVPILGYLVNCLVVAEVLYSGYDIRSRLHLYYSVQYNLLRILIYGLPLTILQYLCSNTFILNYLYNTLLIIQVDWMMWYPSIHRLHIPTYQNKRVRQ